MKQVIAANAKDPGPPPEDVIARGYRGLIDREEEAVESKPKKKKASKK